MLFLRNVRFSLFLISVLGFTANSTVAAQDTINIGGTGTGTLLIQHLVESYAKLHPNIEIKPIMPPMGSNGGLRALAAGAIQIAVVTFPATYPAKPDTSSANIETPWVKTPFVFTGRDVTNETKLSLAQVASYYSGRTNQWPDGKPVRLITRTERESDTRILRAISPDMDAAVVTALKRTGMPFAENDFDNQELLEKAPGSLGTIALGQILLTKSPLKPAILDGVTPSKESLQIGTYHHEKPLYLITSKTPSAATLDFIKYLKSPDVMKLVSKFEFIPMQN